MAVADINSYPINGFELYKPPMYRTELIIDNISNNSAIPGTLNHYLDTSYFKHSNRPISTIAPVHRRMAQLRDLFLTETRLYSTNILVEHEIANGIATTVIGHLAKIEFQDASVELTGSNAIKVTLLLNDNPRMLLMVTKPFHQLDDLKENEVVFSIFNQNELVISHVLPLSSLVESISAFLETQMVTAPR